MLAVGKIKPCANDSKSGSRTVIVGASRRNGSERGRCCPLRIEADPVQGHSQTAFTHFSADGTAYKALTEFQEHLLNYPSWTIDQPMRSSVTMNGSSPLDGGRHFRHRSDRIARIGCRVSQTTDRCGRNPLVSVASVLEAAVSFVTNLEAKEHKSSTNFSRS